MNKPPILPPPLPPMPLRQPPAPPRRRYSTGRQILRAFVWMALVGVVLYRVFVFRPEPRMGRQGWGEVNGRQWGQERRESWRAEVRKPRAPLPTNLWRIELELTSKAENILRSHHQQFRGRGELEVVERPEVTLTVREGGQVYTNVSAHLKGAAGSFRPYDDTPGFTLNFSKHAKGQKFHGYSKISLNNSVQDPTLMNELISRELFVAAGVPVPKAQHATVVVNGRDLGLYVVLEGWGKPFLKGHFDDVSGNLYDGGFVQDIDGNLSVVSGEAQDSHPGLERLIEAVRGGTRSNRWERLSAALDVDRFAALLAMDTLICNWDGYAMNRNNWRVFHDRSTDKMVFMPHGLDQLFGFGRRMGIDASIEPSARGQVARVFLSLPEGRKLFHRKLVELRTNVLDPDRIATRIREVEATLQPTLEAYSPGLAAAHASRVQDLIERVRRRAENVTQQLERPQGGLVFSDQGVARLTGWRGALAEDMAGRVEFERRPAPQEVLLIRTRGEGGRGSWRMRARLEEGEYRMEGRVRLGRGNVGSASAGLRISGELADLVMVSGEEWLPLRFSFAVVDGVTEVDLVAEVIGSNAEVEFDGREMRLVRGGMPQGQ